MEFNKQLAQAMAKPNCRGCWGRGFITRQFEPAGFPIVYQKYDSNGNVKQAGSAIYNAIDYCTCSRKKIKKLEDELSEKAKEANG